MFYFPVPVTETLGFQDFLNSAIIGSITIPPPPPGYPNDFFIFIVFCDGCNVTNSIATVYDTTNTMLDTTQYYLGTFPTNPDTAIIASVTTGYNIIYPTEFLYRDPDNYDIPDLSGIDITFSNACSSITEPVVFGCFLPGTPVALAGGITKPIEDVKVGDLVIGAFGEVNPVTALHRPLLGGGKVCRINDEHTTTTHHPHIGADRGFFTPNPAALNNFTYGQKHTVILGDGTKEKRVMTGVRRDRILKLEEGTVLQTLTGPKAVTKLEPVAMSPFTQVYHLVVGGSHTYTVDGYAVVGWAREDDFDYDSWSPKTN
jgi:hypothetical protein